MSRILAIDPGQEKSGWIIWDSVEEKIINKGINPNEDLLCWIESSAFGQSIDAAAIEMVGHYGTGMAVGNSVFDTCVFIGELKHALERFNPKLVLRPDIRLHFCHHRNAKPANVNQVLRDRFGEKGTKKNPGKLFGVSDHIWSALAVAVYFADKFLGSVK
jgi:hypothetical protein